MTNDGGSGLELDDSKRPPPKRREPPPMSAHAPVRRPRPAASDDVVEEEVDSSTGGAFIVLALLHLVGGLGLAVAAPDGSAVVTLAVIVASALVTFAAYYITGWIGRHLGVIGMILFGGWFAFIVGMLAQLVHQMFPWLSWKILGVVAVISFAIAFGLDMR